MNDEFLTIRQMCDEFDVTPRTLRFYEAKELLSPRREGQRRLFGRRDRARMKLIRQGKKFGFALEDIRRLLNLYHQGEDGAQRQIQGALELGEHRLAQMEAEREALGRLIAELRESLAEGRERLRQARQDAA